MALPNGYTELTYIQSSGTQYIDTGFQPNSNTRVVIDCEPTETTSAQRAIFGARNSTSGQASLAYGFNIMNATSCRSDYMGSNATISGTYSSGTRMSVDMNKNVCTVNGQTGTNTAKTSGQTPYNLFLFNVNNVGTPHSSFGFKGKIYSCKIYDNGTLVRDFVPCKNASGTVGLYDVVNSKFYANAGSGAFAQGSVVSGGDTPTYIPPVEGHNTVIGGTAYAITGGKVLVGGTVYEVALGKTLVDGTARKIAFAPSVITVNIKGNGNSNRCYARIYRVGGGPAGETYYMNTNGIELVEGDHISFRCYSTSGSSRITLNGETAVYESSGTAATYSLYPTAGMTVDIELNYNSGTRAQITITTS